MLPGNVVCPEAAGGRTYALFGDRLVVGKPAVPGTAQPPELAFFDLPPGFSPDIPASAGAAVSSLAVDEAGGRLAWTADAAGAFLAVYDVATGSLERVRPCLTICWGPSRSRATSCSSGDRLVTIFSVPLP